MTLFNADGSRAEMSGNGIRCFAQAIAAERGDLGDLVVHTDAGERTVTMCDHRRTRHDHGQRRHGRGGGDRGT